MLKFIAASVALIALSSSAFAEVPADLDRLLPSGRTSLAMRGSAKDGKTCWFDLSSGGGFSAIISVVDDEGEVLLRRMGRFQLGFGHELESISSGEDRVVAVSTHEAEESYSQDTRSTFTVRLQDGEIKTASIQEERKGLFGYKKTVFETCSRFEEVR
ncbi:MAG: hypothetical protein NDJ90_07360 [Oligoflexia bacterium]|nr:hypothetical protein [Oligoflexia bacterium]